jgi:hypothetical protein
VLQGVTAQTMSTLAAVEMLKSIGIDDQTARRMIASTQKLPRPEDSANAQAPAPSIMPVREAEDSYSPPEAARNNARRVLKWRDKHGDAVAGMTQVGWTRANQLASGENLSRETVGRMAAFARHRKNADVAPEYEGEPWRDAGHVAWLGWGGTSGVDWAAGIVGNVQESSLDAAVVAALESVATMPEARAILENMSHATEAGQGCASCGREHQAGDCSGQAP